MIFHHFNLEGLFYGCQWWFPSGKLPVAATWRWNYGRGENIRGRDLHIIRTKWTRKEGGVCIKWGRCLYKMRAWPSAVRQSVHTLLMVLDSKMATVDYDATADPEMDSLSDEDLERYFKKHTLVKCLTHFNSTMSCYYASSQTNSLVVKSRAVVFVGLTG